MSKTVEYPYMRYEVISALHSLASPEHQHSKWGHVRPGVNYYDDFTLNVHILYDDCQVLPDPSVTVGTVLHHTEIDAFDVLSGALTPLLDDLGDQPDETYTKDPRWQAVIRAARAALEVMTQAADGG